MAELNESHLSVRFRHGVHTIYLFVDSGAPFSEISKELAEILRDRYPGGLTTSREPPRRTDLPPAGGGEPRFVYGLLNKDDDPSQGWRRVSVGDDESHTPDKCGLKNNSLVAFMLIGGDDDPNDVVFRVEFPVDDDEMYEKEPWLPEQKGE